jgi:hypothetical protein
VVGIHLRDSNPDSLGLAGLLIKLHNLKPYLGWLGPKIKLGIKNLKKVFSEDNAANSLSF